MNLDIFEMRDRANQAKMAANLLDDELSTNRRQGAVTVELMALVKHLRKEEVAWEKAASLVTVARTFRNMAGSWNHEKTTQALNDAADKAEKKATKIAARFSKG